MNKSVVEGFVDELSKIAHGGAADIGAEALGLPGALLTGGKGGFLGAGAGFLGGLAVRHGVGKLVDNSNWGKTHPIGGAIVKAIPLALGTTAGAAAGQQMWKKHAGVIERLAANIAKTPTLYYSALNGAGSIADRHDLYERAIDAGYPVSALPLR